MESEKSSLWKRFREKLTPDPMFHETEVQANRLGGLMLFCSGLILSLILILTIVGIFPLSGRFMYSTTIQAIMEILILLVICKIVKNDAWWLKPILLIGIVVVFARLDSMLTHKTAILMVLPVVFSSRYFSRKLTVFTSLLTTVAFALSAYWGATHGLINLNIVTMEKGVQMIATGGFLGDAVQNALKVDQAAGDKMLIVNTLLYDYFPKWLMFSITTIISCNIARRGRNMVISQHEKDLKTARIESELDLASNIQADMLPNIYPAFPDRSEFDIYATMNPAKEVGGDFYDFFLVDDNHLCMVMADVSGKGVPAALFMMVTNILVSFRTRAGGTPSEILSFVNDDLCEHNTVDMFVTIWLGILELSSGKFVYSNAGHEDPAVYRKKDNAFELVKTKHGFIAGGMPNMKFSDFEMTLEKGDRLFIYTDGVPEATNKDNKMFGLDRMMKVLNKNAKASLEDLLKNVHKEADGFVGEAPQFDDLTMLCLERK